MRILNCTKGSWMICLRTSDIVIKGFELSMEFNCTEKVLKKITENPGYQNRFRFIMNPSERQLLDTTPIIPGLVMTLEEAKNLSQKLKSGYVLPKMDIRGNIIEPKVETKSEPTAEANPEVESETKLEPKVEESTENTPSSNSKPEERIFKFVKHSDEVKLSKSKDYKPIAIENKGHDEGKVIFTSSDPKVATISNNEIIVKGKGKTFISASLSIDGNDVAADKYQLTVK